jgi:hypothetical protein
MARVRVPPALAAVIAAQRQLAAKPVTTRVRPATIGVEQYSQRVRVPLQSGYAQGTVAGGTVTVQAGPAGVGTVWYPTQVAIATTTGAADTSTCTLYAGPLAALTQIGSQSYAGGGDSVGLSIAALFPGSFIVAVWSGAHNGDLAQLTIYGQQDCLAVPT